MTSRSKKQLPIVHHRREREAGKMLRVEQVDQACELTPGIESPTVSPLHDKGWVAVRSMVERARTNAVMDELHALGAKGILVTEILACRL